MSDPEAVSGNTKMAIDPRGLRDAPGGLPVAEVFGIGFVGTIRSLGPPASALGVVCNGRPPFGSLPDSSF